MRRKILEPGLSLWDKVRHLVGDEPWPSGSKESDHSTSDDEIEAVAPEASLAAIMMAGVGGLLAFFGLSFGLVAAVADPGFLIVALVTCCIAAALFMLAYVSRRNQLRHWQAQEEKVTLLAKCSYCGLQNSKGRNKCLSCGAPLGHR